MNILRKELRYNRRTFLVWLVTFILASVFTMSLYPAVAKDSQGINQLIKQLPQSFIKAFNLDKLSMTDILGYFGTKVGLFLLLGGSIYAMILGGGMLAKEEDEKTIEFLLAKPITRSEIITEKMICYLVYILLFDILVFLATYITLEQVKLTNYPVSTLVLLGLAYFLAHITFANIGLLISVFVTKRHSTVTMGIGLVLGLYFISTLAEVTPSLEFLKYFTPFQYANATDIIVSGKIHPTYLLVLVAANVVAVATSYFLYNRKNIAV